MSPKPPIEQVAGHVEVTQESIYPALVRLEDRLGIIDLGDLGKQPPGPIISGLFKFPCSPAGASTSGTALFRHASSSWTGPKPRSCFPADRQWGATWFSAGKTRKCARSLESWER